MRPAVQSDAEGSREIPVRERRLRVLAGRVLVHVAVPHRLPAARLPGRERSASTTWTAACASARTPISSSSSRRRRPRTKAGGRPTRPGRRLRSRCSSKADATRTRTSTALYGYRDRMPVFALAYLHDALVARREKRPARASPTCGAACRTRSCPKAGSAHVEELDRSVSALVLELERALDGDRAEHAGQGVTSMTRRSARWCAG